MMVSTLVLMTVLSQEALPPEAPVPSAGSPGRTAALVAVGIGVPVLGTGIGALVMLPQNQQCHARRGALCGLEIVLGMLVGGVVGLLVMPLGLWLTDLAMSSTATGDEDRRVGRGGLVGALIGLGAGLAVGIGLLALSTTLHQSAPVGEVVVAVTGGVVALAAPIAGFFVGRAVASSKPQVSLVPLREGALLTIGAAF